MDPRTTSVSVRLRTAQSQLASRAGKVLIILTIAASASAPVFGFATALAELEIIGLLAAVAGLRWRPLGLLGIGMLCTLETIVRPTLFTGGALRFNSLNYWLLLVIALNFHTLLRWKDIQTRLLLVLIALLVLGLITSPGRAYGIQHVLNLVSLLGVLIYVRRAGNDRETWFWLGSLTGCVGACVGALFYLQREELDFVNMNSWAYVPLTGIFGICLAMAVGSPRRSRSAVLALLAVANALWVLLSGSRGGMLVALVCGVFLLLKTRGVGPRVAALVAAGLAVFVMGAWFADERLYSVGKIERLLDSSESSSKRTDGHWDLAAGGWYVFVDHPLGVGTGGFAPTWAQLRPSENVYTFRYGREMQAHSAWVKTLAENGVPGFLCLTAFVLSFAWVGWRSGRVAPFWLGAFVTVALATAFLAVEFSSKGLWLLVAGAIALLAGRDKGREAGRAIHSVSAPGLRRLESTKPGARRHASIGHPRLSIDRQSTRSGGLGRRVG
jgi:hypothetical protein